MSVLIKDMEMPKHCGYCRFRYDGICHALQKTRYAMTDCPLVEIPTPHGRLIDGDKAKEALRRAESLTRAFGYHNVIDTISEVPTIIEAEEGEEA